MLWPAMLDNEAGLLLEAPPQDESSAELLESVALRLVAPASERRIGAPRDSPVTSPA